MLASLGTRHRLIFRPICWGPMDQAAAGRSRRRTPWLHIPSYAVAYPPRTMALLR